MRVVLPEVVSAEIYFNHFAEQNVTYAMLKTLRPGMVVCDVGAHLGAYSLLTSRLVGSSGIVHAFEPTSSTFSLLQENVRARKNIILHNVAVYSENTMVKFRDYGLARSAFNSIYRARIEEDWAVESETLVPTTTLDSLFRDGVRLPDFVKIDAESAELHVLKGMEEIIRVKRPVIALEVGDVESRSVDLSRDVVMWLLDRGYRCFEHERRGNFKTHEVKERYIYDNLIFATEPGTMSCNA
jgi:FkbM family methyltransferase